jgi:hypothetical protein
MIEIEQKSAQNHNGSLAQQNSLLPPSLSSSDCLLLPAAATHLKANCDN